MMKKFFALITASLLAGKAFTQQVSVAADASLQLYPGVSFAAGGLTLKPSSSVTLSGLILQKNTAVTNSFDNPYVTRVYNFGSPLVFSGDVQFQYDEAELNGLDESLLQLLVYSGSAWQIAGISNNNVANNFVLATGITNQNIEEMILTSYVVLPLTWRTVTASRQLTSVKVQWSTEQESDVSHFDIERSINGVNWITAIANIPAGNHSYVQQYEQTDHPNYAGMLYYRIRQIDINGRSSLSNVVTVNAEKETGQVIIYPNPVKGIFTISGIETQNISKVHLFNNTGGLLKSWNRKQSQYAVPSLSPGVYYIRIQTTNGITISKRVLADE